MDSTKLTKEIKIRVRYAETDRMGFVYYGNYATYFEVARVEWLRELGINYLELENNGIALPVVELKIRYFKPAFYDQFLTVRTLVKEFSGVRLTFGHETFNESGELINSAEVQLVFINTSTLKPSSPPEAIIKALQIDS